MVASQSKGGIKVLTTGPRTTYGPEQIAELPSLNRDIKDLLQRSPLVTIDPTNSGVLGHSWSLAPTTGLTRSMSTA